MKSNDTVIIEAMAARIRELEGQIENQHSAAEEKYNFNNGVKATLSKFINQKKSQGIYLEFEKHINHDLVRLSGFQPDVLDAYLWVFEIADDEGLLEYDMSGLDDKSRARIRGDIKKYRAQLSHWEKTGESPKN